MILNFPWTELVVSSEKKLVTRRIFGLTNYDIFITKDYDENYQIIIKVKKNYINQLNKLRINISSIKIDIVKQSAYEFLVLIKLLDQRLIGIFDSILNIILSEAVSEENESAMVHKFLQQIKRWQKFMSVSNISMLSEEKIRGLIAELTLLSELLTEHPLIKEDIIESWYGPDRLQHDFIFNNSAIEVKSISNLDKKSVTISSEHQLESNTDKLFLRVYCILKSTTDTESSINLNKLIRGISENLDVNERSRFDDKLIECSYIPNEKYEDFNYRVELVNTYEVIKEFPKLCSTDLSNGVLNVKYDIDLNKIENFVKSLPANILD